LSWANNSTAQSYNRFVIVNGDSIPIVDLPPVHVGSGTYSKTPVFKSKRESWKYKRLKRYVKKVYPYALLASKKINECSQEIIENPASKKLAMKKVEKALKDKYGPELKKLTMMQGKILLLLIDRQTGNTAYELVKELRGGFSASMYQGLARLFRSSLKVSYEPQGKDWMIEDIVKKIERGVI
tara:strand:- start:5890 stop:6438 length:549 start_codon:yes stop_codon:yes gene_type:complete